MCQRFSYRVIEKVESVIIPTMLEQVLGRIDAKLEEHGLAESAAAVKAGLSSSAIRNMRRAVKAGLSDRGASIKTLEALAPVLQTSAAWLMTGESEDQPDNPKAWEIYQMIRCLKDDDLDYIRDAALYATKKSGKAA